MRWFEVSFNIHTVTMTLHAAHLLWGGASFALPPGCEARVAAALPFTGIVIEFTYACTVAAICSWLFKSSSGCYIIYFAVLDVSV